MKRLWMRRLAVGVFVLNLLAVTWPVLPLFRTAQPMILGLPQSLAWPIGWIVIGWATLLLLDHVESSEDAD
ncbi:MAG: hypothetical protein AAFX85_18555 [Pseudomonadota bacterium]